MKPKIIFTILVLILISGISEAQLKINEYGTIGVGIEPNPDYKMFVKGNLVLTTYPETPPGNWNSFVELRFKVGGTEGPYAEIGSSTGAIAFRTTSDWYNSIWLKNTVWVSDSSLKTDITPLQEGLEKVLQLNAYSYKFKHDTIVEPKTFFGFLAQDVRNILPEMVDSCNGVLGIDYIQIIPLLVNAVKEQQLLIDSIENIIKQEQKRPVPLTMSDDQEKFDSIVREIDEIKTQLSICCSQQRLIIKEPDQTDKTSLSILYQNKPNPFTENTIIEFEIEQSSNNASIMIFDMQGTLKKVLPVTKSGRGQITISGHELAAGMYLYTLIVDNKEIDTKRMILVN